MRLLVYPSFVFLYFIESPGTMYCGVTVRNGFLWHNLFPSCKPYPVWLNIPELLFKVLCKEFPLWLSGLRTQHLSEDEDLIPSLALWVKDPVLPQAVVWAGMQLGSSFAVAVRRPQLQLQFDPWPKNFHVL